MVHYGEDNRKFKTLNKNLLLLEQSVTSDNKIRQFLPKWCKDSIH